SAQSRYALGHVMSAAWAAFARTGDPNHADMPKWPVFDVATYPTMVFGERVHVANDPNHEARLALAELKRKRSSCPAPRGKRRPQALAFPPRAAARPRASRRSAPRDSACRAGRV